MTGMTRNSFRFLMTATIIALGIGAAILGGPFINAAGTAAAADVVVYKSPTCGCCSAWMDHLQMNGFSVEAHDRQDMDVVKTQLGVPANLQSCHTATIDGFVIEGHVPADLITRLLKERPPLKGLAVPGMPLGSPGMEGPRKDPYDVMAFQEHGAPTVYAHR